MQNTQQAHIKQHTTNQYSKQHQHTDIHTSMWVQFYLGSFLSHSFVLVDYFGLKHTHENKLGNECKAYAGVITDPIPHTASKEPNEPIQHIVGVYKQFANFKVRQTLIYKAYEHLNSSQVLKW